MISSAAEAKENVDQLIYLSAILLEPGESMQLDGSKIQIDVDANLISEVKKKVVQFLPSMETSTRN